MKLKLDENLGCRGARLLEAAGHEVTTVVQQDLCAANDRLLIERCREEQRCLVTLDLDFGNPLLFAPSDYFGIAVLRLPPKPTHDALLDTIQTLIGGLQSQEITGRLWIVQRGRVRIYEEEAHGSENVDP